MLHNFSHSALWSIWTYIQVAQMVESLPAKRDTWVQSPSQEDALEKELATHSSILTWRIPWTEEPGGLQSTGSQRVRHDWATFIWETNTQKTKWKAKNNPFPAQHSRTWLAYLRMVIGLRWGLPLHLFFKKMIRRWNEIQSLVTNIKWVWM